MGRAAVVRIARSSSWVVRGLALLLAAVVLVTPSLVANSSEQRSDVSVGFALAILMNALLLLRDQIRRSRQTQRPGTAPVRQGRTP